MKNSINTKLKSEFQNSREKLFGKGTAQREALRVSMNYSIIVEEFIFALSENKKYNFALASGGSFSRRELSPCSDIDLIFIVESTVANEKSIVDLVTAFWDNGIEVSHTVREFSDLERFLNEDLHTFTQFFETRFLLGSEKIYADWNKQLFALLTDDIIVKLLTEFFEDIQNRYKKYGDSPKVIEPNVKMSAGGLRDFQAIEWMFILSNRMQLNKQNEITQAENFIQLLEERNLTTPNECKRLLESYNLILAVRNLLHILHKQKRDRFEFSSQLKIAKYFHYKKGLYPAFMKEYFNAANVINRFCKSMVKRFQEDISNPLPDALAIELDEDFLLKGKRIYTHKKSSLSLSAIFRGFYYRGLYGASFDESLRSLIVESVEALNESKNYEAESSVFFREILRLPRNVGQTLAVMNELGVLGAFLHEFKDMVGFLQHGVYHCYTADEHTLVTIENIEKLEKDTSSLGKIYNSLRNKEILYLALLFHDIAKPINVSGHEILGAEVAASVMFRLGFSEDEIEQVASLVRNHLAMEQTAFRRNLNDPETLNNFTARFKSLGELNLLYLLTYADLSAVNPAVWTTWKSELLSELYTKSKVMILENKTAEELLVSTSAAAPGEISKHSNSISEKHVQEHIDLINDLAYASHFSEEEIARHVEEIRKGIRIYASFKGLNEFTSITVITKDFPSLLSKLCGVFSINDLNIHDAQIFTRKDGIVIDTFSVSDFRTNQKIAEDRYDKIKSDLEKVISGELQLSHEFKRMKSKWWRIENKLFKRSGKVKISFEKHDKYTIVDVFSPDRIGFLYQITNKMNELGLNIFFAKISTKEDDIVDAFYILDRNGRKISPNNYELIRTELTNTINEIL